MSPEIRAALVTGGTRGIGRAIARRLAGDGFGVAISGQTEDSARRGVASLAEEGIRVRGHGADATLEEDQKNLIAWAVAELGRLDILVNNAGIGDFDRIDRLSPSRFRRVVETNLFGPYYAMHYAAPHMKKSGGFIVNIGSLASINPIPGGAAYNASKFGLLGLSDAAMLDLRHEGIRIAVVLPGSVATEFDDSHGGREDDWMLSADDVALAVSDLVRFPDRAIPSRIELRPSRPPRK